MKILNEKFFVLLTKRTFIAGLITNSVKIILERALYSQYAQSLYAQTFANKEAFAKKEHHWIHLHILRWAPVWGRLLPAIPLAEKHCFGAFLRKAFLISIL